MATFKNPANTIRAPLSVFQQGQVTVERWTFSLAGSYAAGAGADESIIVLGYVPADCVLIPHLCRFDIPQLDAHVSPTGDYYLGTEADTDALKGTAAAETAVVLSGEDLLVPATQIGSKTEAVAIVVHVHNVIATLGTGTFTVDLAYRPWNTTTDG